MVAAADDQSNERVFNIGSGKGRSIQEILGAIESTLGPSTLVGSQVAHRMYQCPYWQSTKQNRPVAVMHFAAFAYVGESVEQPLLYYQNNVGSSATLFRAIIETRTIPVVFSSTCATYGVPEKISIPEEHPHRPVNPYGFSKLVVERILTDLGHTHGLRSIALRYFNAAGADPDGEIGEVHDPEPHLIPRVLAEGRDGTAVTVYGPDSP
jgi:UDP-glucose 4-epimerase